MKELPKIFKSIKRIENFLINEESYWAHISQKKPETLKEHANRVINYAFAIVNSHQLDNTIIKIINEIVNLQNFKNKDFLIEKIYEEFFNSIAFHDFGKVNENFQSEKMQNSAFRNIANSFFKSNHSDLGAYIYLVYYINEISGWTQLSEEEQVFLLISAFLFSYIISKHHSRTLGNTKIDIISKEFNNFYEHAYKYLKLYQYDFDKDLIKSLLDHTKPILNDEYKEFFRKNNTIDNFPLFALLKLNFSLLTASDYIATSEYMLDMKASFEKFGVFSIEQKKSIIHNFKNNETNKYNQMLYEKFDEYKNYDFKNLQKANKENLNILRQKLCVDLITKIRENLDKNLFYIEAPTGGGKTNLSMLALVELLSADIENNRNEITKVFYVFPFTTLITQTYTALQKTLGLTDSEIIELHSKAGFKLDTEEKEDGLYGDKKLNYIDNLFSNYPFCLLSHIKFFDILKSNQKEISYLLHKIANSIVIIDELQSYNPDHWNKINYFIQNYAKYFNIKFILMSATLPKIGNLHGEYNIDYVHLIENKNEYFTNPNFKNRTLFDFSLLKEENLSQKDLCEFLFQKSKEYYLKKQRVFTIIEFIFKKTATEFYDVVSSEENFFDEIFVLSGTILESRRKEIIHYLKKFKESDKKILLITTQVVEAGVDIDMDIGFKNKSLIDSDEQLAGRINRNASKADSVLYLFKINEPDRLYGRDERYKKTIELGEDVYRKILQDKDFDFLYNKILVDIEHYDNRKMAADNLSAYTDNITNLNFNKIDEEFKLIEQENQSIFVPLDIPIEIPNSEYENSPLEKNFSEPELKFLADNGKYNEGENIVSGKKVWEIYEGLVKNKNPDFMEGKADFKTIQGIMSKFIFSIFANPNTIKDLKSFGEEKYGFIYLENHEKIYNYEKGISEEELKNSFII